MTTEFQTITSSSGREYAWSIEVDESYGNPWQEHDGHGPVSDWVSPGYHGITKRPGERILYRDRHGAALLYDFAEALKIARRDGWGPRPDMSHHGYDRNALLTPRQRAHKAVMEDMNRLRRFCEGDWFFGVISVAPVCTECGEPKWDEAQYIGGVDSDDEGYAESIARECLAEFGEVAA